MTQIFSTADVRNRDRFEYWSDAVCATYVQLNCETPEPESFNGSIQLNRMSRLATSFVSGSSQTVKRRAAEIARAADGYFLVSLQLAQNGAVEQGGRTAQLQSGDFALYSSIDPYVLRLPDHFRQLVIQMPREEMLRRLPDADLLTGRLVSGRSSIGELVGRSLLDFSRSCADQGEQLSECMQDTIFDLIVTGLSSLESVKYSLNSPERQILLRANQIIKSRFADHSFNRIELAAMLGISVRRLSEVFRHSGTSIAASIREKRLQLIAERLRDGRYDRYTVSEIALGCGMNNLQHFSALFRNRFGMPPSEYRNASLNRTIQ